MEKKISVIVPIYNSEKHLKDCLNSICNQTIASQLEVILIDDGSTDSSAEICKEFKKGNGIIKFFQKKNEGVSSARNFGINKSKGKYVIFIDSDDIIAVNYIELLYKALITNNADMAMCNVTIIKEEQKKHIPKMSFEKNANTIVMNSKEYISNILDEDSYYTYATNKLIKRDIIGDIRFRENIYYNEDGLFFLDIASNLNKVVFIYPLQVYFYIQSHNNSHLQTFNERFLTIIDSFKEMEKYFEIFNESNKSYFSYRFISYYLEANYYQKKNKKIKSINNSAFKEVKKKYLNYALKSDNLSFFQKSKFVLKILFPNTVMKLKEKMR